MSSPTTATMSTPVSKYRLVSRSLRIIRAAPIRHLSEHKVSSAVCTVGDAMFPGKEARRIRPLHFQTRPLVVETGHYPIMAGCQRNGPSRGLDGRGRPLDRYAAPVTRHPTVPTVPKNQRFQLARPRLCSGHAQHDNLVVANRSESVCLGHARVLCHAEHTEAG